MNARLLMLIGILLITPEILMGQSLTTEALHKKNGEALSLFFYANTLRMLNQSEDKEFDEIIKDIEKMRFLMIDKKGSDFGSNDYKKLLTDYKSESYEEIMTSRYEGKNFDVYMKEKDGKTKGMLVLINDSTNLYVLDILGRIALDKVTKLYSTLDKSSDIGKKIKAFTGDDDDDDNENHGDKKSEKNH
ncbi:MAG: DUF4252 domain-containing protein [Cyclobacteriaceae bacterium]